MELRIKTYAIRILVCLGVTALLLLGIAYAFYPVAFSWKILLLAAVFYSVCLLGIVLIARFAKRGGRTFISGYMAVKAIKMVLLLITLLVFFFADRDAIRWITVVFFTFYIVMLVFDTVYFSRILKK